MNRLPPSAAFWCLLVVQVVCAQSIFWSGLPVYRKLLHGKRDSATVQEIGTGLTAIVVMQAAFWVARRRQRQLEFRHRPLLGHFLMCAGELSFVFPTTIAAVALFDESIDLALEWWRLLLLGGILFAMFCYKVQLQSLGEAMRETPSKHPSE